MRAVIVSVLSLGIVASTGAAAEKGTAGHAAPKSAPECSALVFRALPSRGSDGEQSAGMYKSRFARLELRGTVKDGTAGNYYLAANGSRVAATPQLPSAATECAHAKKMPPPERATDPCTGERFTAVLAHAGDKRVALLYALNGSTWSFCNAGSF
jgi:hypothetical protein